MGGAKRMMEHAEELYSLGVALCLETGALQQCPIHDGMVFEGPEGQDGLLPAYKLAAFRVAKGLIDTSDWDDHQRDVTDAVKEAFEDNSGVDYCTACDRD